MTFENIEYYKSIVDKKKVYISSKNIFDKICAIILLIILFPFLLIVSILVKITSNGTILYKEKRLGYNGREFEIIKFRSMINDINHPDYQKYLKESVDGTFVKPKDNPRITKFGRILRKTSIDELPQLYNIIKGEMSFVGPRASTKALSGNRQMKEIRSIIRPGLTGLWQISNRENCLIEDMIEYDIKYIEKFNFWYDIKIILNTIPAVITCRGAY